VFNSESTKLALLNSLIVGVGSTGIAVVLGVPASLAIARRRFPGRDAIYALVLSPITVPWVVFGLALLYLAVRRRCRGTCPGSSSATP
jgi:ABC-type spermidine/putrescine transport system permease subunit II